MKTLLLAAVLLLPAGARAIEYAGSGGEVAVGSIDTAKLATDAVTAAKILNATIDSSKLATGSVDTTKMGEDAVTTAKVINGAVNTAKLASDAVTNAKVLNASISLAKLAAGGTYPAGDGAAISGIPGTIAGGQAGMIAIWDSATTLRTGNAGIITASSVTVNGAAEFGNVGTKSTFTAIGSLNMAEGLAIISNAHFDSVPIGSGAGFRSNVSTFTADKITAHTSSGFEIATTSGLAIGTGSGGQPRSGAALSIDGFGAPAGGGTLVQSVYNSNAPYTMGLGYNIGSNGSYLSVMAPYGTGDGGTGWEVVAPLTSWVNPTGLTGGAGSIKTLLKQNWNGALTINGNIVGPVGLGAGANISTFTATGSLTMAAGALITASANTDGLSLAATGVIQQVTKSCTLGLTSTSTGAINGCVTSDLRAKTKIISLAYDSEAIDHLRPVFYRWRDANRDTLTHSGFIAQEVQKAWPTAVVASGPDRLGVDPNAILAAVVAELQALRKRVKALEARK
mgnify:CR=1 FL=1